MANFEENKQYIIRWNIEYTTASGSYTTYAYTGIKFPLLAQAGMTTRQYYYGTYGDNHLHSNRFQRQRCKRYLQGQCISDMVAVDYYHCSLRLDLVLIK